MSRFVAITPGSSSSKHCSTVLIPQQNNTTIHTSFLCSYLTQPQRPAIQWHYLQQINERSLPWWRESLSKSFFRGFSTSLSDSCWLLCDRLWLLHTVGINWVNSKDLEPHWSWLKAIRPTKYSPTPSALACHQLFNTGELIVSDILTGPIKALI